MSANHESPEVILDPSRSLTLRRGARKAAASGSDLLTAGASVGAIGLVGAALGAVCPVCVVVTPALVGLGLAQKARAAWLERKAARALAPSPTVSQTS